MLAKEWYPAARFRMQMGLVGIAGDSGMERVPEILFPANPGKIVVYAPHLTKEISASSEFDSTDIVGCNRLARKCSSMNKRVAKDRSNSASFKPDSISELID